MTIELSEDDFDLLLWALGYAIGSALRDGNGPLANRMLALANWINKRATRAGCPTRCPRDEQPA